MEIGTADLAGMARGRLGVMLQPPQEDADDDHNDDYPEQVHVSNPSDKEDIPDVCGQSTLLSSACGHEPYHGRTQA
jgi:hypothetical protein